MALQTENGWFQVGADLLDRSPIPGTDVVIPLQIGWPSIVLKAFAADIHAYVESIYNARGGTDEGGWTPQNSVWNSNHLSGTAFDYNWSDHTFRISLAGFTPAEEAGIRELLAFYTYKGLKIVFWGQDWTSPRDSMHFQMNGNTHNNPLVGEFISKFIRPDGFSTLRRGGGGPVIPRKIVVPDAGGLFWCDVSQYQVKVVDESYSHRIFSFRTNSGDKRDALGIENARAAKELLDKGKLDIVIPYYFFRPMQANCDLHREMLEEAGLFNHPRTVTMVDIEGGDPKTGLVTGNNSWEINDEVNRIRKWYSNFARVIGYYNSNADPALWPTRGNVNLVVPQYNRTPGDISGIRDSQVKIDAIAHQFTSTALDQKPWEGMNVDVNWSPYNINEMLVLFGMKEAIKVPTTDEKIHQMWQKVMAYPDVASIGGKWPSRAVFRDSDEGVDDTIGMLLNTDGNTWDNKVIIGAMLGDSKNLARIQRVADGLGPAGDNEGARKYAQSILKALKESEEEGNGDNANTA
jgi:hypothetical protein